MPLRWFALSLSLWVMVVYNIPFFRFVADNAHFVPLSRTLLLIGLAGVMLALNYWIIYLLIFFCRYVGRILVALSLLLNAAATYFVIVYAVFMDASMLENVFNTRYSEAAPFVTWPLAIWFIVCGILPALWVLCQRLDYGSWRDLGKTTAWSLLTVLLCATPNVGHTLWFGEYDTELGGLLMPWSYTVNMGRLAAQYREAHREEIPLPDAVFADNEPTAVVLVIGESARRANSSLYGYARETNPLLSRQHNLHVLTARSCATYTTAGVKAILEYKDMDELYEVLPNYLYRAGADVVWRTSNWGEPPIHIDEYEERTDSALFAGVKERILASDKHKVLICLHTSTSHGPAYHTRYPESFEYFSPVSTNVEESRNDLTKLYNAYDNSIRFTDYLLSNLIDTLRTMDGWHTAMLYVSDHGESLGENGLFMHGMPLSVAPREQYEIPMLLWMKDDYRPMRSDLGEVDQHYVFHTVLNLMNVSTPIYDPQHDLLLSRDTE